MSAKRRVPNCSLQFVLSVPLLSFVVLSADAQYTNANATLCASKMSQNLVFGDFQYPSFLNQIPANTWYVNRNMMKSLPNVVFHQKGGNPFTAAIFTLDDTDYSVSHDIDLPNADDTFRISGLYDGIAACNGKLDITLITKSCQYGDKQVLLQSNPITFEWSNSKTLYKNNLITNRRPIGMDFYFMNSGSGKAARATLMFKIVCSSTPPMPAGISADTRPSIMLANIQVQPYPTVCEPKCGDNLLVNGNFQYPNIALTGWTAESWNYGGMTPSDQTIALSVRAESQNPVTSANVPSLRIMKQTFQIAQSVRIVPEGMYELSADWFLGTRDEIFLQLNMPVYDNERSSGPDSDGPSIAYYHWNDTVRDMISDNNWHSSTSAFTIAANQTLNQAAVVFRAYKFVWDTAGSVIDPDTALIDNIVFRRVDCWNPSADQSPPVVVAPACVAPSQPTFNISVTSKGPKETTSNGFNSSRRDDARLDQNNLQSSSPDKLKLSLGVAAGVMVAIAGGNLL